jgi:cytochrome c oxidase accessory protein FixG
VLLTTLVMGAGFLLLTVVLGRVWCGWLCPQTVLNDLVDLMQDRLQPFLPGRMGRIAAHSCSLLLAAVVSINLLCWFLPPVEVARDLLAFRFHAVVATCFLTTTILLYLNLVLVRRGFCRSFCPYGRFQAALLDEGTLNLAFLEETSRNCIRCKACVSSCPMGIDIRLGYQVECISCGRCIDACRAVMERVNGNDGLIAYRFGAGVGNGPRIGPKTAILTALLCILVVALAWGIHGRSDTAFSVQRIATAETRTLADGSQVQAWRAIIGNRGQSPASFALDLSPQSGVNAELLGPVSAIRIAPNENRQVSFFIRINAPVSLHQSVELRLFRGGDPVAAIRVTP